jgi:circadian clock protein KaiB
MNHQESSQERLDLSINNFANNGELPPPNDLEKYVFRLYVADSTIQFVTAVRQIQKLCKEYLPDRYELEIIDIYRHPERLEADQVFASPTLIKELPPPLQRLIGDLSDTEKVKMALLLSR